MKLEVKGEGMSVEADEQLFRQMLFNLLLNTVPGAGYWAARFPRSSQAEGGWKHFWTFVTMARVCRRNAGRKSLSLTSRRIKKAPAWA